MIRKLMLWWYRREARLGYLAYHATAEAYDCGRGFLLEVSTSALKQAGRHDGAMLKLKDLEPDNFPKGWEPILGELS